MDIFETTYNIKLPSSKDIRTSFEKLLQELCNKNDCKYEMEVKTKWYCVYDRYIVKIFGTKLNTKIIEKQLRLLTKF